MNLKRILLLKFRVFFYMWHILLTVSCTLILNEVVYMVCIYFIFLHKKPYYLQITEIFRAFFCLCCTFSTFLLYEPYSSVRNLIFLFYQSFQSFSNFMLVKYLHILLQIILNLNFLVSSFSKFIQVSFCIWLYLFIICRNS